MRTERSAPDAPQECFPPRHTMREVRGDPCKNGALPALRFPFMSGEQENMSRKNSGGGYSIHQHQGNKQFGTEKVGFLYKKSDG